MTLTHANLLAATFQYWSARVWIDGKPYQITSRLPTRTLSGLRPRSVCSVDLVEMPPATGDLPVIVELLMNGVPERFFTGKTGQRSAQAAAYSRQVNVIDYTNLDKALAADITWNHRSFPDAMRDVLAAAGMSGEQIDSIYDPGSGYTLAPVYPITLKAGENIGQCIGDLMTYGGTALYTTASGRVRVVDAPGIPAASSGITYATGNYHNEFGITDAGFSIEGNEGMVAQVTATGPKRSDGAVPDGTATRLNFVGRKETINSRFLQSDSLAQTIAERELNRRARDATNIWFSAPLNPILSPGDTIFFRAPELGYTISVPASIVEVATDADAGMRVQIVLNPSRINGYRTSVEQPSVDFSMLVEQQPMAIGGVAADRAFVQCRDQSRDRNGYAITGIGWTATGLGVVPASLITWSASGGSSDPPQEISAPVFLFESLEGAEITLTVESESGESASITKTPVAVEVQVFNRVVTQAGSSGWGVLVPDGWRYYDPGDGAVCTAVPGINETGPIYSGWDNGAIYASRDALATPPTLRTILPAAINCLWVNESTVGIVLAGAGDALHRSSDAGVTWTLVHDFGAPVRDCQNSPANPGEMRVCAGNAEWLSFDGGASWSQAVVGPDGSFAMMMAQAPWGHAVAFSGVDSADNALLFEQGNSIDWTLVPEADRPTEGLLSITPMIAEEGYIGASGAITDLMRDGTLESMVFGASGGGGKIYKFISMHGSWIAPSFAASLLVDSLDAGPVKLVNQLHTYPIDTTTATQIGYGNLGSPAPQPGNLVLPTKGVSGANDGIWAWANGVWVKATPPVAAAYWLCAAVNPYNSAEWIILGDSAVTTNFRFDFAPGMSPMMADGVHSPVWHTADAGATWTPIALSTAFTSINTYVELRDVAWGRSGGWVVLGKVPNTSQAVPRYPAAWDATGVHVGILAHSGESFSSALGLDGEVLFGTVSEPKAWGKRYYPLHVTSNGTWGVPVINVGTALVDVTVVPGTRMAFAAENAGTGSPQRILTTNDYRSAVWVDSGYTYTTSSGQRNIATMVDGTLLYGLNGDLCANGAVVYPGAFQTGLGEWYHMRQAGDGSQVAALTSNEACRLLVFMNGVATRIDLPFVQAASFGDPGVGGAS